jgi:hypothetical protein
MQALGTFDRPACSTKSLMWDRQACRRAINRVLSWDFDTVIPTHGVCPLPNAKQEMADAFRYLS